MRRAPRSLRFLSFRSIWRRQDRCRWVSGQAKPCAGCPARRWLQIQGTDGSFSSCPGLMGHWAPGSRRGQCAMNGPFGSYGRERDGLGRLAAGPFWEQSGHPLSSSGAAALPGILGSILCPAGQRGAPWPRAGGNQADLTPTVPASLPSGLWTRSPHRGFQKCRAPLASQREHLIPFVN